MMSIRVVGSEYADNFYNDFLGFVYKVDHLFEPPLSERVVLEDYAKKLYEEAHVFVVFENDEIQAASAFYCTPEKFDFGFLSFVASLKKGLGSKVIEEMISHCKKMKMKGIETQTWETNYNSLTMFKRYGFLEVEKVKNRDSNIESIILKLIFND
ncbi:GNAT family N-acetyltransferase [Gelidibacter mesophilus]|uniref:GNAT family N-acetyltransferase n=1 Tax=Gelidibacter mesophilus TaxID=169050 RepID=UPI00040EE18D|nr:GNAT family N-acetyltransferase [Gelidibacter mesophilus]